MDLHKEDLRLKELRQLGADIEEGWALQEEERRLREELRRCEALERMLAEAEREAEWEARLRLETAAARQEGKRQGGYRDAFIHYFPHQCPEELDRHFPDAFPYARTFVPLSPLLHHEVPAAEVFRADFARPLGEENVAHRGIEEDRAADKDGDRAGSRSGNDDEQGLDNLPL